MCKIQAFGLLVVTLLLFSQESSGAADNRNDILRAATEDVKTLKESINIKQIIGRYRMPQNVPENCSLNALACVVDLLDRIYDSLKFPRQINEKKMFGNINTNIRTYLVKTLHPEVKPKEMCNQCDFPREKKTVSIFLADLLNLLQRVTAEL
ncbi:uncharacterized protein LOC143976110 [Lithobates pipiens]